MEIESEREKVIQEIQQKIGRNVLLFQKVEFMLKFLLANSSFEGKASEIKLKMKQQPDDFRRQSMGQLVGGLFENTLALTEPNSQEPEVLDEPYIIFRYRVETSPAYVEKKKLELASIVEDRNELIHNFLPRLDFDSPENCSSVIQFLDQQRDKLKPEIEALGQLIDQMQETRKAYAAHINSDEGKKEFELSWLRQSRLVILLVQIAEQNPRPDGWVLLSVAGRLLWQRAPEEMVHMRQRYGHRNLKQLVMAPEIFDITEDTTGGMLYRIKPDWVVEWV